MKQVLHFYITKYDNYYTAECAELAIVTQGDTLDEVVENIKEASSLHLESENLAEFGLVKSPLISINMEMLSIA